jgi:hypothetical protein
LPEDFQSQAHHKRDSNSAKESSVRGGRSVRRVRCSYGVRTASRTVLGTVFYGVVRCRTLSYFVVLCRTVAYGVLSVRRSVCITVFIRSRNRTRRTVRPPLSQGALEPVRFIFLFMYKPSRSSTVYPPMMPSVAYSFPRPLWESKCRRDTGLVLHCAARQKISQARPKPWRASSFCCGVGPRGMESPKTPALKVRL